MFNTSKTNLPERVRIAAALLLAGLCIGAAAADQVVAVKGKQVEAFAVPDNAEPGVMMQVANLPWTIKEEKNGFLRVALGSKDVWVDAMQVSASRGSTDNCPGATKLASQMQRGSVAGAPGAGRDRCR